MRSQKRQRNHDFVTIRSENPKVLPLPDAGELFSQICHIEAEEFPLNERTEDLHNVTREEPSTSSIQRNFPLQL